MRVSLAEINALRGMDRVTLADLAEDFGILVADDPGAYPTNDSLRLAIIDRMVQRALDQEVEQIDTASKVGAEHFAEAILIHAHAVEFGREAERLDGEGKHAEAVAPATRATRHFEVARSAAAIAQAGLTASMLAAVGDMLREMGS